MGDLSDTIHKKLTTHQTLQVNISPELSHTKKVIGMVSIARMVLCYTPRTWRHRLAEVFFRMGVKLLVGAAREDQP